MTSGGIKTGITPSHTDSFIRQEVIAELDLSVAAAIWAICYSLRATEAVPRLEEQARMTAIQIDESTLAKGQSRKLRALRSSVGDEIADRAFLDWLVSRPAAGTLPDGNATTIVDTLWPLVQQGTLSIPRGGYLIRRGRGRLIVERHLLRCHAGGRRAGDQHDRLRLRR